MAIARSSRRSRVGMARSVSRAPHPALTCEIRLWRRGRPRRAGWRRRRAGSRVEARLLPFGQGALAAFATVDRLFLERWQPAFVVGDHEYELELVEVGRRLQIGRLDHRVRVAPDVDDLPDEQALRIGRSDAATQLEPGRDDLVALDDDLAGVDLLHHEHTAELTDDLTPRGV